MAAREFITSVVPRKRDNKTWTQSRGTNKGQLRVWLCQQQKENRIPHRHKQTEIN